jgi:sec-independent protein translocase protein TatA
MLSRPGADEFYSIEVTMTTLAFLSPGPWQFVIVLLVVLVLFGNRLPSVMRSLGEGITEFKKGIKGGDADTKSSIEDRGE